MIKADLNKLVDLGVVPVLHYTPMRPEYADQEDLDPRWCCHNEKDETFHHHGDTPEEAVRGLLRLVKAVP